MDNHTKGIIVNIGLILGIVAVTIVVNTCMFRVKADSVKINATDTNNNNVKINVIGASNNMDDRTVAGIYLPAMSVPSQNIMDITDLSDYLNNRSK